MDDLEILCTELLELSFFANFDILKRSRFLNLDPINGQIWTRAPRIYGFYYTKILQKILESIWEHPGKILSLEIRDPTFPIFFEIFER